MTEHSQKEQQSKGRRMNRFFLSLMAAGTLAAAILGFAASPASADAAPPGCPATYLCFYADPGYSGGMGIVKGNNSHFKELTTSTHNCGNGNWNDCVSSAFNNGTSCTVYLWSDANYQGKLLSLGRGHGYTNLKSEKFDDALSSNHWCTPR